MKKVILLVALVGVCATAQAKVFAYGVKAGVEMPSFNAKDPGSSADKVNGGHVGGFAQINVPIVGIGVQPEVLYVYRGVNVLDRQDVKNKGVSYIDVPVNITWGIDLKIVRPFLAVTPYASYALNNIKTWVGDNSLGELKKVDNLNLGIGFGAGVELFKKLQVMGRYNYGLKKLTPDNSYKMRGVSLSVGYIF